MSNWDSLESESFPNGSLAKDSACSAEDVTRCRFDPRVGLILWKRKWQPIPYPCLKNLMEKGANIPAGHEESNVTKHKREQDF